MTLTLLLPLLLLHPNDSHVGIDLGELRINVIDTVSERIIVCRHATTQIIKDVHLSE